MTTQPPDTIITLLNNIQVRRYRQTDIPSLAHHANNRKIWDNLRNRMPHPYTLADSEAWVQQCQNEANWIASGPYTPSPDGAPGGTASGELLPKNYVICIDNEAVGSIGLEFGDSEDIYARNAEIGYWLSERHWGQGVMGRVVPAFVEWTWQTFGRVVRINSWVYGGNVGSIRCLERAGFIVEGGRKGGCVKNGRFVDEVMMGALRPGFEV